MSYFKPATQQSMYRKLAVFGGPGQGKSILALSAPGNKLVIDTESGVMPYASLTNFETVNTQSFGKIKDIVEDLSLNPPEEETTLIIDSASIIWAGLQVSMLELKLKEKGLKAMEGTEKVQFSMADWAVLKRWNKDMMTTLMSLKCHVICTFRESEIRDEHTFKGTGVYVAEWEKNSPYVFDFVGRIAGRSFTFTKGRMAKDGKLIDLIGKKIEIPTISEGKDMSKIWASLFGSQSEKPTVAHVKEESNNDTEKIEKDPEVLRIAKEIRSSLLPKRAISNEDLELYLKTKVDASGERIATEGQDGKIHLGDMRLKSIKWLQSVLEDNVKALQLAEKIKELRGVK